MIKRAVTDESLGIRLHEVNRQRAVDRAIERMRYGLKADWHYLTLDDIDTLRWLLGELWSTRDRDEWEQLHFSKLGLDQARRIVSVGDRLRRHRTNKVSALESAIEIITSPAAAADTVHVVADASFATA